tara:strand:+ start:475 stop:657 length:183 start_codon:yes stop_codon:yes gene_type:complete
LVSEVVARKNMGEIVPGETGSVAACSGGNYDNVWPQFADQISTGGHPCPDFDPGFYYRRV